MVKFFKCMKCGSVVAKLNAAGRNPSCCGEPMKELIPGSVDASLEKHVPVVVEKDNKVYVQVGSAVHPTTLSGYTCSPTKADPSVSSSPAITPRSSSRF